MDDIQELIVEVVGKDKFSATVVNMTDKMEKLIDVGERVAESFNKVRAPIKHATNAIKAQSSAFSNLAKSIKRIMFYRAIRTALKAVTQGIREGINNLVLYSQALGNLDSAHANQTMSEFATTALYVKNSVGAALMPILQMLVPIVNAIADAFIWAANAVNQFFHAIKGENVFTKAKRYTVDYADSLVKAGGAAKELKKQVFGFDELNIFNAPSAGGGGGGTPALDPSKMFEEAEVAAIWDRIGEIIKDKIGMITTLWDGLGTTIKQKLAGITTIVSAATLAVGAILALSGVNPALGIGLMAAGVVGVMAGSINWNTGSEKIRSAVAKITAIVGGALLAFGAILTFSNANVPLGVGMMIAGAVSLASAATINWDSLGNTVDEKMGAIVTIASGALLALGAILAFVPTHLALGLGLMAAGAIGLATGLYMNDSLKDTILEKFNQIKEPVSLAALALGAILMFIPSMLPLGLGLLALGAVGLASSLKMNDELKNEIKSRLADIEMILGLSTAGLGAALMFVNPAIGLPLLITGLGLIGANLDWDALNNKIKEKWEEIKQTGRNIKTDILRFVESIKNFFKSLFNFNASMTLTPSMQNGQNSPANAKLFASGGQPETGSLFWAGEAGAELVGQVGGRTTVTTHDQFTEGMSDIMDNTNTVILQAAQALISAIQNKDMTAVVNIADRDIVSSYDRGKRLAGASLVE